MKLAVIGTAGRKQDAERLNKDIYNKMYKNLSDHIESLDYEGKITLISGGAAWADHLAVDYFINNLKKSRLELYLPSKFEDCKFVGSKHGEIANYYHKKFSDKTSKRTLLEIETAQVAGAKFYFYSNFFERNSHVAQNCDAMIAYTFSSSDESPADGGTSDTWKKCKSENKTHVNLNKL